MLNKSKKHLKQTIPRKTGSNPDDTTTDVLQEEKEVDSFESRELDHADNFNRQKDRREDSSGL